ISDIAWSEGRNVRGRILASEDSVKVHSSVLILSVFQPRPFSIPDKVPTMHHPLSESLEQFRHSCSLEVVVAVECLPNKSCPALWVARDDPRLAEAEPFAEVTIVVTVSP